MRFFVGDHHAHRRRQSHIFPAPSRCSAPPQPAIHRFEEKTVCWYERSERQADTIGSSRGADIYRNCEPRRKLRAIHTGKGRKGACKITPQGRRGASKHSNFHSPPCSNRKRVACRKNFLSDLGNSSHRSRSRVRAKEYTRLARAHRPYGSASTVAGPFGAAGFVLDFPAATNRVSYKFRNARCSLLRPGRETQFSATALAPLRVTSTAKKFLCKIKFPALRSVWPGIHCRPCCGASQSHRHTWETGRPRLWR